MVPPLEIHEISPPPALNSFFLKKSRKLWSAGERTLLEGKLVGVISARKIDTDLALNSSKLLKELVLLQKLGFIGGWHSPLEEDAFRILLDHSARVVFCISKSLHQFSPAVHVEQAINSGRVLLLTQCGPKAKRMSRDASIQRNKLVVGLAAILLVLAAPRGSDSLKLAISALCLGKPVLSLEHPLNKELLASGAFPATLENIQRALQ